MPIDIVRCDRGAPNLDQFQNLFSIIAVTVMAFAMGFAIRRGSVCLVDASQRAVVKGKTLKLRSFAIAAGAAGVIIIPAAWAAPNLVALYPEGPITLKLCGGAALFAIGARFNGGCAFGTLSRLSGGQLRYLGTVLGAIAGAMLVNQSLPLVADRLYVQQNSWAGLAAFGLCGLAVWPALKRVTFKNVAASVVRKDTLLRPTGAMLVIGCLGGTLFAFAQSWTYLSVLSSEGRFIFGMTGETVGARPLAASGALVAGAVFAAVRSGRFSPRWASVSQLTRHGIGGIAMGAGAAMVPGSNGVLVLYGVPSLSLSAITAYAVMSVVLLATFLPERFRQKRARK